MDVLAFPFRFQSNGAAVKVVQGSDADLAQKLAALVQTEPGELPLAPHYGIADPTFHEIRSGEVIAAAALFYPELVVSSVSVGVTDSGRSAIQIAFEAVESE